MTAPSVKQRTLDSPLGHLKQRGENRSDQGFVAGRFSAAGRFGNLPQQVEVFQSLTGKWETTKVTKSTKAEAIVAILALT